jgi:Tfp pilus assembly protein PilF
VKALEIDDALAEAHAVRGLTAMACEWNWTKAERAFNRATELNPNNAMAH